MLIEFDEETMRGLRKFAPPRQRARFVREAVRRFLAQFVYEQISEAYRRMPFTKDEMASFDPKAWTDLEPYPDDFPHLRLKRKRAKK